MTKCSKVIRFTLTSLLLYTALLPLKVSAQEVTHRLTKEDVVKLLQGQVTPHRVGQRAREQGIDFQVAPQVDSELRRAGATDELIDTLLEIEAKTGQVLVHTSAGAEVYLDDQYAGRASAAGRLLLGNAKPGEHSVRVSLAGKKEVQLTITVVAGQEKRVDAALEDAAGSIRVQTVPGAEVLLDESSRGKADGAGQLVIHDVAAGSHQLRVSSQGMTELRQGVSVLPGQESTIQAILTSDPISPPAAPTRASAAVADLAGTTWDVTFVCYDYYGSCKTELMENEKRPDKHPKKESHTTLAFADNGACSLPADSGPCHWVKTGAVVNVTQAYSAKYPVMWGLTINGSTMSGTYHAVEPYSPILISGSSRVTLKLRE